MTNRPGLSQIDEFMTRIGRQRGMSLTTGFNVEFDFRATSKFPADRYKKDKDIINITNYLAPEHIEILLKNFS